EGGDQLPEGAEREVGEVGVGAVGGGGARPRELLLGVLDGRSCRGLGPQRPGGHGGPSGGCELLPERRDGVRTRRELLLLREQLPATADPPGEVLLGVERALGRPLGRARLLAALLRSG